MDKIIQDNNLNTMATMGNTMRSIILYTILTNRTPNIFQYNQQTLTHEIQRIITSNTQLQHRLTTLHHKLQIIEPNVNRPTQQQSLSRQSLSYLHTLLTNIKHNIQHTNELNKITKNNIHNITKLTNTTTSHHTPHPKPALPPEPTYT